MKRFIALFSALIVATGVMTAQDAPKKYEIKSGTFTTVSEVMGHVIESTTYFDDYGRLETSKVNTFGMVISTISRDGKVYMVNHSAKQVQEMPVQESVNYLDLTDEIIAKYKITEAGTETVSEKDCVKYNMEVAQTGQTAKLTVSVWNGIPMKTITSTNGMDVTTTVTSVVECDVDPALFIIPTFE